MVDEVGVVKGLRGYGIKEEFANVTAVAGRAYAREGNKDRRERYDNVPNVVMFAQIRPTIPGKWDGGRVLGGVGEEWLLISGLFDVGPLGPTPAQAGMLLRRGWFGRLCEGFVPNVEMCELEKEMDKDESVVFRVGWTTR
jgi:hypothetical protein